MRWTTNTTTMRERSRRASAQPAVGRRGLRPRDQEEQRTQRASFAATNHTGVHTQQQQQQQQQQVIVLGSDAWLQKKHVKRRGTSLRGQQTRVSQRRLGCLCPGQSEVRSGQRQT